jgi:hypothetical protein
VSPGKIAGIVIGSIAGAIIIGLTMFWLFRRCHQRRHQTLDDPWKLNHDIASMQRGAGATRKMGPSEPKNDFNINSIPANFFGPLNRDHARVLYSTLQEGDIRVLEIMKGKDDDDIICQLWLHTIEPQSGTKVIRHWPGYEAISYVWAQKPRNPEIKDHKAIITVVNPDEPNVRVKFVIGWNLNEALKFFRQSSCSRILWTDQICINQDKTNPERMAQVLKMKEIYEHATQIQVWLGPSMPESERPAEYFAPFEEKVLGDEDLLQSYRSAQQRWEDLFDGFQNRPWWTRAWIIQEVMSSADPVLNSGPDSLSFNLVLRLVKFALNKDLNLVTSNSKINVTSRFPSLEIVSMRDRMRSVRKPHLSEWLTTFHNQSATNPRDRIFAYLGLARHALPFAPQTTYTHRIEDVWAEGTKLALYMSNNLDFICLGRGMDWGVPGEDRDYIPPNPEERSTTEELEGVLNLPSWVPNFRVADGNGLTSARMLPLCYYPHARSAFNASGGLQSGMFVNEALTELEVLGFFVDKIKRISKSNFGAIDGPEAEKFLAEVLDIFADVASRCWESCSREGCTHYPGPHGGSYPTAICKTLVMDLDFHGERLKPEYGFHTLHYRFDEPPASFKPAEIGEEMRKLLWNQNLYNQKSRWTNWRRFFVTERGYIGVATRDCQVGDSIYIMGGATIPFIMREKDSTSVEGIKKLTFVGERYVSIFQASQNIKLTVGLVTFMVSWMVS